MHSEYEALKRRLARGWNTWNTRSVTSHVLLPESLAINLGLKERILAGQHLRELQIGRLGQGVEVVRPGPRTWDGGYTELSVAWTNMEVRIQSATDGADVILLVTPLKMPPRPGLLVVEPGFLWNRPGHVMREGRRLIAHAPSGAVSIFASAPAIDDPHIAALTPYLAIELRGPVVISTGRARTPGEVAPLFEQRRAAVLASRQRYGELAEVYAAIQTVMAWDTYYEPQKDRVISNVSRIWNVNRGGWGMFCWDNFFGAYMCSLDHADLAHANALEIMAEKTEQGFVPNCSNGDGRKSWDRSQPPVGSMCVREIYRKTRAKWFLEAMFDDLLVWNRWWEANRDDRGLLCWGSNPHPNPDGFVRCDEHMNKWIGAALESGIDNGPQFDDVPFDPESHLLRLWDVGLTGLYVMDCDCLADIARVLGRPEESELRHRADKYRRNMARLWDEPAGIHLDRRADTDRGTL